jgi:hypothetical protein
VRLSEPSPEDVERAVETLRLVFKLVDHDPVAGSMKCALENIAGINISRELERWLKHPTEKRDLRNRIIQEMKAIWERPSTGFK